MSDTCTKRVTPPGSYGAFHTRPCGRPAVGSDKATGDPRCNMHIKAAERAAAADAKRDAEFKAKALRFEEARRQEATRNAKATLFDELVAALDACVRRLDSLEGKSDEDGLSAQQQGRNALAKAKAVHE